MTNTVIFYDTEYTAWEGSQQRRWSEPWEHRELIQIAAIKVDIQRGFMEQAAFDRFVKPQHNPILSDYISNLTGIHQASIDAHGVPFADAWADFYQFCERGRYPLFSWGDDPGVLLENCGLNSIDFSAFSLEYHDIRTVFEQAGIDTRQYSSGTVHRALEIAFALPGHNALHDVRSLLVTMAELSHRKCLPENWFRLF